MTIAGKKQNDLPDIDRAAEQATNAQYQELSVKAEYLYRFVNLFKASFHKPQNYAGYQINMVEVHDLTYIDDHPGVSTSAIAQNTRRTRGAVSQILTRLEKNGLIRRVRSPENSSMVQLYTTEVGKEISDAHKRHDVFMLNAMNCELSRHFSKDEIDCFFRILAYLSVRMTHDYKKEEE